MDGFSSFFKRKILRINRDRWNYQYSKGMWEGLRAIDELARFSVIVGYVKYLKPGQPDILEIGCGEGLLQQRLQTHNYGRYVGIDLSDVAIEAARTQATENCTYEVANMDNYEPQGQFDFIIFNEVIYYSKHPLKTLQHFATFLKPNGLLIVTINNHKNSDKLWNGIKSGFNLLDEATTVTTKSTCICKVLMPFVG